MGLHFGRRQYRAAGVTDTLETTVVRRVGAPAGASGDIKLAVVRREPPAVRPGAELAGKGHGAALLLAVDSLLQNQKRRAITP